MISPPDEAFHAAIQRLLDSPRPKAIGASTSELRKFMENPENRVQELREAGRRWAEIADLWIAHGYSTFDGNTLKPGDRNRGIRLAQVWNRIQKSRNARNGPEDISAITQTIAEE